MDPFDHKSRPVSSRDGCIIAGSDSINMRAKFSGGVSNFA